MHEYVIWFQVSMHNILFSENSEGLNHLSKIYNCSSFCKRPFLLHESIKGSPITEFINKIEIIDSFQHIDILNNIRTVLHRGQNIDLIDCAFLKFWYLFKLISMNNFYCHLEFRLCMDSSIYLSIYSLAKLFLHGVVFDYLPHCVSSKKNLVILVSNNKIISNS